MTGVRIALTGKMRAGKDSVADYLVNHFGFQRYALGDALRAVCNDLFPDAAQNGKPRELYQDVGQALRQISPDVWVNYLLRQIEEETGPDDNIVITDLRQWNEYFALLKAGFTIGRIRASELTRLRRMKAMGETVKYSRLRHETEQTVDKFCVDFEITNEGSRQELYNLVDAALLRLKKEVA
ncbi:AAA family ATPase [Heliobacterium undosum]|uniref:AAA family ATPase n=1 Tax=Heliomicrobium undosum TaxID=121734 RepID=A0A845KY32_9FIRM|nr:AAA family ATPase [Heliomicrobium undosum]MZP28657.1 AAA family ATPase [Heliomicrobium undosum]